MAEAERVLRELARAGMTREDHVVALGGGVVGDLAGFCAHIYQRGVPVVQVPTTLVAQVDSAYGGKTGVDLPEGKNYAGAYHLPAAVLADTATLATPAARGAGGRLRRGAEDRTAGRRRALGAGAGDRVARPRRARRRRLRLRPLQVRGRRRRRARRGPARRPQPRPHGRPRDRGGERLRALPPRRGGRPRPAGGAAALRGAGAARRGRGDPAPPRPAGRASTPRSTSTRSSTPSSATRSAPPRASASSCSPSRASPARGSSSIRLGSGRPWRSCST